MAAATDESLSEVVRLLALRAGMAADSVGAAALSHAVQKRLSASGEASPQDYVRRLGITPAEFQELLEELVVPETWFFRDGLAFRCLARRLEEIRPREGVLRILCAGCSTGEEVYTVAMTLREAGLPAREFSIVGADLSHRSLDLARKGQFTARSFRERDETAAALCQRWFERMDQSYQVRDELRAGIDFRAANLSQPDFLAGAAPFHVVFCRNVLIYFHVEARGVAVSRLRALLRPEGLLFSASAEARIFSEAGFGSLGSECPSVFRREKKAASAAASPSVPIVAEQPAEVHQRPPQRTHLAPRDEYVQVSFSLPLALPLISRYSSDFANEASSSAQPLLAAAEQAADKGRLDEADTLCGQVLAGDAANAAAHYLRGVVRQAQGAFTEAQQSLEKALYLDPKHRRVLVHLMLLAEQRGDGRAADNYRRRLQQAALTEAQ